jgi:transcription antitermination factor NusG
MPYLCSLKKTSNMEGIQWYALYTRSRHEKRVRDLLEEQGVEVYLPEITTFRRYSDRMKKVQVPLFTSYLFVRTNPAHFDHYTAILNTPGAVRFVTFEGQPIPVPEQQVDALKRLTAEGYEMQALDKPILPGTPVEIMQGPLKGIRGEVIQAGKTNSILLIRIDALDKNLQVKIPAGLVESTN